jgi:hypothetical protein
LEVKVVGEGATEMKIAYRAFPKQFILDGRLQDLIYNK